MYYSLEYLLSSYDDLTETLNWGLEFDFLQSLNNCQVSLQKLNCVSIRTFT